MTEQHVLTHSAADDNQEMVFINQTMLGKWAISTNHKTASVMFTLIAHIGSNGTVKLAQAAIAHQCGITLREIESAIVELEADGLISSVEVSTDPGGSISCVVNPDLARSERPGGFDTPGELSNG